MATAAPTPQLTDTESQNEFHRVIALQYECVTDGLRELLDYKLITSKRSLDTYLRSCHLHLAGKPYVTAYQQELLQSPNPDSKDMDLTMLTLILLAKCNNLIGITKREKKCIEKLREHRNAIAHNVPGRLNDNKLFTETSNDIIDLSQSLKIDVRNNLKACIDELKQRICVRIHSKLDVIQFDQERLRVILIQEEESGQVQGEAVNETLLKFNLTKWAKHIARGLDLQKMMKILRQENVITIDVVERIDNAGHECDNWPVLLDFLIKEGTKIQVLRFCKQLRIQSKGEIGHHLADLIEGKNTEGLETVEEIKNFEENAITNILQEHIETAENCSVFCEDLHIYIEEKLGYDIDFTVVNEIISSSFECENKDGRYEGISLKRRQDDTNPAEATLDDDVNIEAMTFQSYADYVGNQFRAVNPDICSTITSAIVEEVIQIETFVEMTEEELKTVFGYYLEPSGYKFGIQKQLQRLQSKIKNQIQTAAVKFEGTLRQFDKPYQKQYKKCEVSYRIGSELLIPAHEFVQPPSSNLTKHSIMKHVVRFITACLNARKNGTIHFGIKRVGRTQGEIVGIIYTPLLSSIDEIIENGITKCFPHLTSNLKRNIIRCTRPAHIIELSNHGKVVVEIDVVPFEKHLGDSIYSALFPPNGPQQIILFVHERNTIVPIDKEREEAVKLELRDAIKERQILDTEMIRSYRSASDLVQQLTAELTGGADYMTDLFYPIICTGKMETTHAIDYDGLQDAFQNSMAVFDFGSSTDLQEKMEDGNSKFTVRTASDFDIDENLIAFSDKEKPWIYCNGNRDLGIETMDADSWTDNRMIPLENVLRYMKKKIPSCHAKVMFLVFEDAGLNEPMVEFAREAFIRIFKHQCIIIGETDEVLEAYENEITRKIGIEKVNHLMFSGLSWFDVSKVFRQILRESSDDVCKLPNSSGTYEELTQKEKGQWKDIDILSMEECVNEEKNMKPEEQKMKQREEETKFYQGKKASWWNFYYEQHGERDLFSKLRALIDKKLTGTNGKDIVESVDVQHEPGAGGSILGRHLIWYFSQTRTISKPYRCCVVKQITENTVNEIELFRQYKDRRPRPVIILLDDEPDGNMLFQKGLHQLAYKTASPGQLFGIVVNVSRVSLANDPVEEAANGKLVVKNILKHRLSDRERQWFEKKYKELENDDVNVSTLIAFNVMRNSFDKEYIKSTVGTIMETVPSKELDILKILSLFGTYEIGICVPSSVFDNFIGFNLPMYVTSKYKQPDNVGKGKPFGIRKRKGIKFSQPPAILDSHCLSLFACRAGLEMRNRGLRIISQPLAEVILRYIQDKQNLYLEDIVMFVLEHTQIHSEQVNAESERFVEVVCSLFKTREDTGKGKDGVKDKFSRLIFAFLDHQNMNTLEVGRDSVIRVMEKCISITGDAFVGQQLARFLIIHKKDFYAAEEAIGNSIALCQNNSYLLDTYGQVFKTNMEFIKEANCQHGNKMTNEVATEVIALAFKAIDKFTEGQITTQEYEKDKINLSCYHMEVRTLVGLLETFELFECYTNEDDFVDVITKQKDIKMSFLLEIDKNESISEIIFDARRQIHALDALRFVEEREYQVKKIYTIYTEEDVLLLTIRERYERFYRSHGLKYQLKFGYGLKPLMRVYDAKDVKAQNLARQRFREAEQNLRIHDRIRALENADFRDLLFFLSFKFIELLRTGKTIDSELYRQLLNYSTKLVDTQRQSNFRRPYLEAYLFFSIFHWPSRSRLTFTSLSSANTYILLMKEWDNAFQKNHQITNREQLKHNKGKNYFALSKDSLGVIDLYEIELEWRYKKEKEEGRSRMHVYRDYFWREPFVANRIKRLAGTLNDTGTIIKHIVKYANGDHTFKIRAYYSSEQLRNRQVTFVLGFTWSGLRAFDVIEKVLSEERQSSGDEDKIPEAPIPESHKTVRVKPKEIDYTLYQRSSTKCDKIRTPCQSTGARPKTITKSTDVKPKDYNSKKQQKVTQRSVEPPRSTSSEHYPCLGKSNSYAIKTEESKQHMNWAGIVSRNTRPRHETFEKESTQHAGIASRNTQPTHEAFEKELTQHMDWEGIASRNTRPTHEAFEKESSQHMDWTGIALKNTRPKHGAFEKQSDLLSSSAYYVQYGDNNSKTIQAVKQYSTLKPTHESRNRASQVLPQQFNDEEYWNQLHKEVRDFDRPTDDQNRFISTEEIRSQGLSTGFQTGPTIGMTTVQSQGTTDSRPQLDTDKTESSGWKTDRSREYKTKTNTIHKEELKHEFDEVD